MRELIIKDGKYKFQETEEGPLICLRYNFPWRVFLGDKAVHALFDKCLDLQEEVNRLKETVKEKESEANFLRKRRLRLMKVLKLISVYLKGTESWWLLTVRKNKPNTFLGAIITRTLNNKED